MFEFEVSPFCIEAGLEQREMPGLFAANAPRRAARLRSQDQLLLLFTQLGSAPLPPNLQQELLSRLAETYFTSAGSVTAGLKATAERLNDFLLNRNLRSARLGGQLEGVLQMAAVHGSAVYLVHAGSAHTFVAGQTRVEHFGESSPNVRGLGLARVTNLRFFTAELAPGDVIVLAAEPPDSWSVENLNGLSRLTAAQLRDKLTYQLLDLHAVGLKVSEGKGEIHWNKSGAAAEPEPMPARPPAAKPAGVFLSGKPLVERVQATHAVRTPAAPLAHTPADAAPVTATAAEPAPSPRGQSTPRKDAPRPAAVTRTPRAPSQAALGAARAASGGLAFLKKILGSLGQALSKLVARAIPGQPEGGLNLSPQTMLFIALAVPVVVVAIASTVYFQRGRGQQHESYFHTAQQFAEQAAGQKDLALQRGDWEQTLFWLDKADSYGTTAEASQLRSKAQSALDGYDRIVRLAYRPALDVRLASDVNITRIAATPNDLYLLDASQGRVLRLYSNGQNYEEDKQFSCGPGKAGSAIIGPLVDIAVLPPNNDSKATVMGIDGNGNLLYCIPNSQVVDSRVLPPPDAHWGKITHMVLFQNTLYVLDPQTNAVYTFQGDGGPNFGTPPHLYFDNQIPHMSDVIDLAADQEFLYLLHADGTMTTCSSSGFATECADPAPYGDDRLGRPNAPKTLEDTKFLLLQATTPPDPSLYVLDKRANAIYHFSLRKLNFQRQYRSVLHADFPLPDRAPSAFTITPNRRVVQAFGNQVFFSPLQ